MEAAEDFEMLEKLLLLPFPFWQIPKGNESWRKIGLKSKILRQLSLPLGLCQKGKGCKSCVCSISGTSAASADRFGCSTWESAFNSVESFSTWSAASKRHRLAKQQWMNQRPSLPASATLVCSPSSTDYEAMTPCCRNTLIFHPIQSCSVMSCYVEMTLWLLV